MLGALGETSSDSSGSDEEENDEQPVDLDTDDDDDDDKKIFIHNLNEQVTEADVRTWFEKNIGEVVEIDFYSLSNQRDHTSSAFLKFASVEQADEALRLGRNAKIRGKRFLKSACKECVRLFVGKISYDLTKERMWRILASHDIKYLERIDYVENIPPPPKSGKANKGMCFLEFSTHYDAMIAYEKLTILVGDGYNIFENPEGSSYVSFANPQI